MKCVSCFAQNKVNKWQKNNPSSGKVGDFLAVPCYFSILALLLSNKILVKFLYLLKPVSCFVMGLMNLRYRVDTRIK